MKIKLACAAAVAAAALAGAGSAQASSIIYVKSGNVYLSSPDGHTGYPLTNNGGWSAPSQADDGTLVAENQGYIVRATPSGQLLNAPFNTLFDGVGFSGPFDVRLSPDGANVAYWGAYDNVSTFDGYNWWELDFTSIWGPSDHFAMPGGQVAGQQDYGSPSWIDSGRLLLSGASSAAIKQVAVYALGGGDNTLVQWFSDPGAPVLEDGVASRDGTKLAFAAGSTSSVTTDEIRIYTTQGLPTGNPSDPLPPDPALACTISAAGAQYPTFSPDGTQLAWEEPDGIHEASVANLTDCSTLNDQLVIPGGQQPFWGPANVNLANAPTFGGSGSGGSGGSGSGGSGSGGSGGSGSGSGGSGLGGQMGGGTPGHPTPKPPVHHRKRKRHRHRKHHRHGRHR